MSGMVHLDDGRPPVHAGRAMTFCEVLIPQPYRAWRDFSGVSNALDSGRTSMSWSSSKNASASTVSDT
ncbi:hypothetical protein [Streptomyces sp. NPDC058307]|uniref:hypothetical protein n=1 Tax=Streptomyces sp. NPDC058307 TaxID=3346439 RepID=UPI0036E79CD7